MIPIRDINPRMRVPFVNYVLLFGIGAVFALQVTRVTIDGTMISVYGFVPATLHAALESRSADGLMTAAITALSSLFLHGGWLHVIGNLLYLRVFGDNVEEKLGHVAFFFFYIVSGVVGAVAHSLTDPASTVPLIGASGAIAGVLGAYVVMFPTAKIVTLFPVFIFLTFIEVPAFVFLGIWGAQQLLNGYLSIGGAPDSGIAWFAHIGGFAVGVVVGIGWRISSRGRRLGPS